MRWRRRRRALAGVVVLDAELAVQRAREQAVVDDAVRLTKIANLHRLQQDAHPDGYPDDNG